jgi:ABC-type multidrug transport system ATPase subunit
MNLTDLRSAPIAPRDDIDAHRHVLRIEADGLRVVRNGRIILSDVSLAVEPGELVAIIGSSGAGKSTLLDAIAGLRPATNGVVRFDGVDVEAAKSGVVGYVPQDDIIHRDLPVVATLRYAARLRLPSRTSSADIDRVVSQTLDDLDLAGRSTVRVGDLSGGQRKRVSIGVELLARPRAFFLDEPTSGLDPATAASLIDTLRRLADQGTTIVLTTHNTDDLRACDRIIVVAEGGVIFAGSPQQARDHFDVADLADIYLRVASGAVTMSDSAPGSSVTSTALHARASSPPIATHVSHVEGAGAFRQWHVLAARNLSILRHSRLTLAIMLGAPALVIAMFATLFRPGALNPVHPDAAAAVSTTYWIVFAAFFFGLTYGLLQICTELPIVRREAFIGVRSGQYLAAKITVLAPVLAVVNVVMLAVMRGLDRLPSLDAATYLRIAVTLFATSLAALALGLLASAAVADPAQATLALPMLCFPAVLFGGAVVPVPSMEVGGRAMSVVEIARWAFEGVGHDLGLHALLAGDGSGAGASLLAQHGHAFDHTTVGRWVLLALLGAAFLIASGVVVRRRTSTR